MNFPQPRCDAPLVVFDFDHTLYDGDSGSHLFKWLIERAWWRRLLAILVAPVAGPMVAMREQSASGSVSMKSIPRMASQMFFPTADHSGFAS